MVSSLPDEPLFATGDRFWEDPSLTERNRLRSRPPVATHDNAADARTAPALWQAARLPADDPAARWTRSLDGAWHFAHYDRPEAVPHSAVVSRGDETIEVPGAWTLQGHDAPIYTNVQMPFPGDPPGVPDDNPTGVYLRSVEVPTTWAGRECVLTLGGAESLAIVYVDGIFVGLATDSRLGSEFDLTPYVLAGRRHTLAIVVVRWSAATWLEDQDQWWHAGIQGSVTLWSRPPVHLAEVALVPGLEPDGTTGTLDVEVAVGGDLAGDGSTADGGVRWWVGVSVEHLDGTLVHDAEPVEVTAFDDGEPLTRLLASATWPGQVVRSRIEVPGVDPWSDEAPNRYRSLVRLWRTPAASDDVVGKGADGEGADGNGADHPSDVAAVVTGFRSVCVADQELRINGAVPLIRGVNRHEHDPDRGRFVDPEHTRAELCLAKRLNVNAVRTAHAPAAPWFYDLCTELGLFVVDETNCETHARQQSLLAGPGFTGAVIERGLRMVGRDRNHPCVVVWSLGNEAGEGAAHHALAGAIRHLDPGRPLSYEGPIMFDLEADNPVSDLVAPMYRSVEEITAWAKARRAAGCADRRRPLILCEYSHAMGNSNGGLADYWDAFRAHHGLQGGFVWEWRDHGLLRSGSGSSPQPGDGPVASEETPGRGGDARWGYGGDFGEDRHDGNFVCDGLLAPDLTPHPACVELAHLQRSLHVEADGVSPGRYRLRSERSFTDTADVVGRWRLEADGRAVAEGTVDVPVVAPGGEAELIVPMPDLDRARGGDDHEMALTLELALAAATAWAPAGHVVARHQFRQPRGTSTDGRAEHPRMVAARAPRGVVVDHSGDRWVLGDGAWALEVDRQQGVVGLARHGRQLLVDRPGHSLWRAPVDNDGMKTAWMAGFGHQARWRQLGLDRVDGPETRRIDRVTVRRREGGAVAVLTGALVVAPPADRQDRPAVECPIVERWSMRDDGTISAEVTWRLPEELADPPRVGLVLALDPAFDRLESYGQGPHECPPDRVDGAVLSRYARLAGAERCPYVLPQCFGQRSGTRWLTVTDPDVGTLTIAGDRPYVHTAHRYSEAQLTEALHADELRPEEAVLLHLDAAHRGVGTASCGPDTAERHRVAPGRHRLAVYLSWADVAPA